MFLTVLAITVSTALVNKSDIDRALTARRGQDSGAVIEVLDAPTRETPTKSGSLLVWWTDETRIRDVTDSIGGTTRFGQAERVPMCELRVTLNKDGRVTGHDWRGMYGRCDTFARQLLARRDLRVARVQQELAALRAHLVGYPVDGLEKLGAPTIGPSGARVWRWGGSQRCEVAITLDEGGLVTSVDFSGYSMACPVKLQSIRNDLEAWGKWDRP